jgi:glycoprotein-N-acetylgalactosamine 3-beta-galactosyltransferase
MDGVESDPELVADLRAIDQGAVPHWHGLRPDMHAVGVVSNGDDEPHGKKVHVLFSKERTGLAASRNDAVDFISLLEKKHEEAGLKSKHEDLLLLLLQPGAELVSHNWLGAVTPALIVPPPLLSARHEEGEDASVAMKLANAVSFAVEGKLQKATSFDYSFQSILTDPSAKDMAMGNGMSFPTPVLAGAATAMRLDTYKDLPSQDESLTEDWPVHLDLSLNLWLCADGIDVLTEVAVKEPARELASPLTPKEAARFAAAWMTSDSESAAFEVASQAHPEMTRLEWDMMVAHAKTSQNFAVGLQSKCRPFSWYAREINTNLIAPEPKKEEEKPREENNIKADATKGKPPKKEEPVKEEVKKVDSKQPPQDKKDSAPKKQVDEEKPHEEPLPLPKIAERDEKQNLVKDAPPPGKGLKLPSKPLDHVRLDILSTAKAIDLKYVNVTGGFKDHPHMGARDENGKWGYIHDEKALRKNPPKFEYPDLKKACANHDANYKMLTEKVFVDLEANEAAIKSGKKREKLFCLVYTTSNAHDRIPYILQTWGPKCDGFMVGSNKTDASVHAVDIPHEGPEEYNNIWQKVRSMWSYIYDNYYDSYDWFHIGGDDLYLLVENLRLYLESEEIKVAGNGGYYLPNGDETEQTPLFLGRRFAYQGDMNEIFISGGSGCTMNKAALKALVVNGLPNYFPHAHTFSEDTRVAAIFKKMGILPYETKDEAGEERYLPFMVSGRQGLVIIVFLHLFSLTLRCYFATKAWSPLQLRTAKRSIKRLVHKVFN